MENKLQQLKDIIWKANPSILELKFGCKLKLQKEGRYYDVWKETMEKYKTLVLKGIDKKGFVQVGSPDKYHCEFIDCTKGIEMLFEILGRDITLADVLMALTTQGRETYYANLEELARNWNLKEDLEGQSDETKQFLIDLLVK